MPAVNSALYTNRLKYGVRLPSTGPNAGVPVIRPTYTTLSTGQVVPILCNVPVSGNIVTLDSMNAKIAALVTANPPPVPVITPEPPGSFFGQLENILASFTTPSTLLLSNYNSVSEYYSRAPFSFTGSIYGFTSNTVTNAQMQMLPTGSSILIPQFAALTIGDSTYQVENVAGGRLIKTSIIGGVVTYFPRNSSVTTTGLTPNATFQYLGSGSSGLATITNGSSLQITATWDPVLRRLNYTIISPLTLPGLPAGTSYETIYSTAGDQRDFQQPPAGYFLVYDGPGYSYKTYDVPIRLTVDADILYSNTTNYKTLGITISSNPVNVVFRPPIRNLVASNATSTTITLNWNRPIPTTIPGDDVIGYIIYSSTNPSDFVHEVVGANITTYTITGLTSGTRYINYTVRAKYRTQISALGDEAVVEFETQFSRAASIVATYDPETFLLSWVINDAPVYTFAQVYDARDQTRSIYNDVTPNPLDIYEYYGRRGVLTDTTVPFVVIAGSGGSRIVSNTVNVFIGYIVTSLIASINGTAIQLNWDALSGASSYVIYLDGTQVGTNNTNSFSLTPIPVGSHTVGVRARYPQGLSLVTTSLSIESRLTEINARITSLKNTFSAPVTVTTPETRLSFFGQLETLLASYPTPTTILLSSNSPSDPVSEYYSRAPFSFTGSIYGFTGYTVTNAQMQALTAGAGILIPQFNALTIGDSTYQVENVSDARLKKTPIAGGTTTFFTRNSTVTTTGLTPNVTFTYLGAASPGLSTITSGSSQPLAVPTNLRTSTVTDSSITFAWDPVADATGYNVYTNASSTAIPVTTTSYEFTVANPNQQFSIIVESRNATQTSAKSASFARYTLTTVPDLVLERPTFIIFPPTGTDETVSYYQIYIDGVLFEDNIPGSVDSWNFFARPPSPGLRTITMKSFNNDGVGSGFSTPTPVEFGPPPKVTGLASSNVTNTSATLTWNAVAGANYYELRILGDPIQVGGNTNTYSFTDLSAGSTYSFAVRAVMTRFGDLQNGEISDTIYVTTIIDSLTVLNTKISSLVSGRPPPLPNNPSPITTQFFGRLESILLAYPSSSTILVSSYNTISEWYSRLPYNFTGSIYAFTSNTVTDAQMQALTTGAGILIPEFTQLRIGDAYYRVERTGGSITLTQTPLSGGTVTSYNINDPVTTTGITPNVTFTFLGASSPGLGSITSGSSQPLAVPTNLRTSTVTQSSITFDWDPVADATGYNVYTNGSSTAIPVTTTSYEITGVAQGNQQVSIIVESRNATQISAKSASFARYTLAKLPVIMYENSTAIYFRNNTTSEAGSYYQIYIDGVLFEDNIPGSAYSWNFRKNPPAAGLKTITMKSFNNDGVGTAFSAPYQQQYEAPPAKVTGLTAVIIRPTSVTLTWTFVGTPFVPGITYVIFKDGVEIPNSEQIPIDYVVTSLSPGTTYNFSVKAINSAGYGPASDSLPVTTLLTDPLPTIVATYNPTTRVVSWVTTDPPVVAGLPLYYGIIHNDTGDFVNRLSTSPYTIPEDITVTGISSSVIGTKINVVVIVALPAPPGGSVYSNIFEVFFGGKVSGLTSSNIFDKGATLIWNAAAGQYPNYTIYKDGVEIGNTGNTTYNVDNLDPSTTYTFSVKTTYQDGNGPVSDNLSVTTTAY